MSAEQNLSRRELLRRAAIAASGVAGLTAASSAQAAPPTPSPTGPPPGGMPHRPGPGGKPGAPGTPPAAETKDIDEVVKGYTKTEGVWTIYQKDNDVYAEIKPEQLNQNMLLQATRATGTAGVGGTEGDPLGDILFTLQKQNDQIYLVEPNLGFRATAHSPESISLQRSFADSYLASYAIAAIRPDPKKKDEIAKITDADKKKDALDKAAIGYLIQIPSMFVGDLPGFAEGMPGYGIDAQKTFLKSVKNFPNNLVVTTQYAFTGHPMPGARRGASADTLADSRSFPEQVIYNLFPLKDTGYKPRFYDDRIGYFTEDYQTFDEDITPDNKKRMIQRWNLVKKDPTASSSEPVTPITFWVDNATPIRYRTAIQEGVLSWNAAFEPLGFKNAVVCNIMPDNADWDTADMRYNVVRWMSSPGAGYAVAQFRHNPLTGEIINSSISIDASWARFTNIEYPVTVLNGQPVDGMTPQEYAQALVNPKPISTAQNRCECSMGPGLMQCGYFGWDSLELLDLDDTGTSSKPSLEEYTHMQLKHVIMHESGHCMGLRHNFKGSMMLTPAQLQDKNMTSQYGIMGSVMDYGGPNLAPVGGTQADYFQNKPGPYDMWAIAYGYTDFGGDPVAESKGLDAITSRSREFGLDFASDENADTIDPTITRYDLSGDPLGYRIALAEKARKMLNTLEFKYPKPGQSYYELTRVFARILNQYNGNTLAVARFIGGIVTEREHFGQKDTVLPVQPVPFADQRRALSAMCSYVFANSALRFSPSLLAKLQQNPMPDGAGAQDLSVLDVIANVQSAGLYAVLDPTLLGRIETNEYRSGTPGAALSVLEVVNTVTDTIWSDLTPDNTGHIHSIPPLRRRLQRTYADTVMNLAKADSDGTSNTDASSFALLALNGLVRKLTLAEAKFSDPNTMAHITETRLRLNRFLHAQAVA